MAVSNLTIDKKNWTDWQKQQPGEGGLFSSKL
jgi:hypothetical protein